MERAVYEIDNDHIRRKQVSDVVGSEYRPNATRVKRPGMLGKTGCLLGEGRHLQNSVLAKLMEGRTKPVLFIPCFDVRLKRRNFPELIDEVQAKLAQFLCDVPRSRRQRDDAVVRHLDLSLRNRKIDVALAAGRKLAT